MKVFESIGLTFNYGAVVKIAKQLIEPDTQQYFLAEALIVNSDVKLDMGLYKKCLRLTLRVVS